MDIKDDFVNQFNDWLLQHFKIKKSVGTNNYGSSAKLKNSQADIYLRLWNEPKGDTPRWPAGTLVIANIEFYKQRKGHGKAMLQFFVNCAPKFGYDKIGLEMTQTPAAEGFAVRFFDRKCTEDENAAYDWITPVDVLAGRLILATKT